MENQKKKSILEQGINWIGACVPTRNELKTQQMKIFFKILLLILCILIAGFVVMVIISIYVLGFLLRFFGTILSFGAVTDYRHQQKQNKHFEESGRCF